MPTCARVRSVVVVAEVQERWQVVRYAWIQVNRELVVVFHLTDHQVELRVGHELAERRVAGVVVFAVLIQLVVDSASEHV